MTQSTDIQTAIATINSMFRKIIKNGNETGASTMYSEAGLALSENSDFESNEETIQTFWRSVMDLGIKEAEQENLELEGNGNSTIEEFEDERTTTISKRDYGLTWD
jgi:ketosteroid isomerase-like protein